MFEVQITTVIASCDPIPTPSLCCYNVDVVVWEMLYWLCKNFTFILKTGCFLHP